MKKIFATIALLILVCPQVFAKTESYDQIVMPVSAYGTHSSAVVPLKVESDGTLDTNASFTGGAMTVADGAAVTLGAKADNRSTATDITQVTAMSVLKEISYMEQNPASRSVTNSGTFAVQNTPAIPTLLTYTGSISATTDIVAADGSKSIYVVSFSLITSSSTANTLTFQDNATTAVWTVPLQALTGTICGANLSTTAPGYLFKTGAGNKLTLNFSSAQATAVSITYYKV